MIVINIQQQQDIRRRIRDDLHDSIDLRVLATRDVAQQQAGPFPRKAGVKKTDVQRIRPALLGGQQKHR